jgi:hypothetical protein
MSKLRYASILMSLLTLLAGCGVCESYNGLAAGFLGQPTPVPNSDDLKGFSVTRPVIEFPPNNSELPLLPFDISTYAGHPAGAILAVLLVNGKEVRTDPVLPVPDPKQPGTFLMTKIDQVWTPPAPGAYYLQVRVTWGGEAGTEITYPVLVYVGGVPTLNFTQIVDQVKQTATAKAATAKPANTATLAPTRATTNAPSLTPTLGPSATRPRITFTPSATATRTQVATATATFTASPTITTTAGAPFLNFTADSTSLNAGQCTTLHWNSGNIQSIFLNGQGTVGTLDVQVCPPTTATYTLVAHTASGDITKQITIVVAGPTSTNTATAVSTVTNTAVAASGPDITGHTTSTSIFDNFADCAVSHPHSVTFTVNVTGATQVLLSYQVQGGGGVSAITMSPNGGDSWTATLTGDTAALPGTPTGTLQYSFSASNASGNTASPTFNDVVYNDCAS